MTEQPIPDAYRIGDHWWEAWSTRRTIRLLAPDAPPQRRRKSPDRWGRTWQAEYDGAPRAWRAYTRLGAVRRAARKMQGETPA